MKTWSIVFILSLAACVSPRDRFNEFDDRVIDAAPVIIVDGAPLAEIPDITGEFLMGISPVFAPAATIQLRSTVAYMAVSDTSGEFDLSGQPLHKSTREPTGDPIPTEDITVNQAGEFGAPVQGTVDGTANPITSNDLVVDIILHGIIQSTDVWCGTITGMVTNLDLVLDGSTFAAIRLAPGTATADLPAPISVCPEVAPADAGVPDAMPDAMPDAGDPDAMPDADEGGGV